ncbi:TetR-like C-terminal domain-containing protein [Streptomyces sp. NPDC059650]|uniref:TetR-like C-terminal domain-containing protein n=1 Tax=Streptomyces sp. NPDC059650 TaxID=3346896 RepID=UPI00367A53AC
MSTTRAAVSPGTMPAFGTSATRWSGTTKTPSKTSTGSPVTTGGALCQTLGALLDAAETLVRERGVDGWSLREASNQVGVSPSAAYGCGYVGWAVDDPAVARLVFRCGSTEHRRSVARPHPHDVLAAELDRLADAGRLPASARPGAEFAVWSAIHGLTVLLIDGLVHIDSREDVDRQAERLVHATLEGLRMEAAPPGQWPAPHTTHTRQRPGSSSS